jgi:hypothetical protein
MRNLSIQDRGLCYFILEIILCCNIEDGDVGFGGGDGGCCDGGGCGGVGDGNILRLLQSAVHHELLSHACGGFVERRCAWHCPSIQT